MVFPQLEKHQNIMQVPEKIQSTLANGHLCKMDTVARSELVPAFLESFYLTLYSNTEISLRWM